MSIVEILGLPIPVPRLLPAAGQGAPRSWRRLQEASVVPLDPFAQRVQEARRGGAVHGVVVEGRRKGQHLPDFDGSVPDHRFLGCAADGEGYGFRAAGVGDCVSGEIGEHGDGSDEDGAGHFHYHAVITEDSTEQKEHRGFRKEGEDRP
jgi:hypothetical protein